MIIPQIITNDCILINIIHNIHGVGCGVQEPDCRLQTAPDTPDENHVEDLCSRIR